MNELCFIDQLNPGILGTAAFHSLRIINNNSIKTILELNTFLILPLFNFWRLKPP